MPAYSFFTRMLQLALALANGCLLLMISVTYAAECKMTQAFMQPDGNAKGGVTSVWSDKESSSLFFIESLNVNTDGTRHSYSVEDFWGEKRALNNLCNAMSDACAGLSKDALRTRRIVTQQAHANGWPAAQLQQTKISSAIIPFKGGKPCPLVDGFLVSATALHKPRIADVCDISNYVDALTTPALVIPKAPSEFAQRAKVGDLVVAMVPGTNQPVYAVIGDTGPARELGEGSIALNGKLLGRTSLPINYLEVRGKGEFQGRGWTVPRAIVLIFPGTRDVGNPFMTPDRIDEAAKRHFETWGGVDRLEACASQYRR
jgi:hypothetical protein